MKIRKQSITGMVFLFVCLVFKLHADILILDKNKADVQIKSKEDFEFTIQFDLPILPENVVIDYAVLCLNVQIEDSSNKTIEILSNGESNNVKVIQYNARPIATLIPFEKTGIQEVKIEITRLVRLWIKEGLKNEGIRITSYRYMEEKALSTSRMRFETICEKPEVKIYYTVI